MKCPGQRYAPGQGGKEAAYSCSGHGLCKSLKDLASYAVDSNGASVAGAYYNKWDADKIQGCVCDTEKYSGLGDFAYEWHFGNYTGYKCSNLGCPWGDDPKTTSQQNEVQKFTCTATGGRFKFKFRGQVGRTVMYNAAVHDERFGLENELELVPTIRNVSMRQF